MQKGGFLDLFNVLSVAPHAFVAVDAALGQHARKTVDLLREEVLRWRDESAAEVSDADCERLVNWMNRNFYRLEE